MSELRPSGPMTVAGSGVFGARVRSAAVTVPSGGTLAAGDSFTLFQAGSISGPFASYSLPSLNLGLGWNTAGLSNSVPSVVQTVATNPTNILASVSGNTLSLSWPSDHTGWSLQSNAVSLVATDAWFTVPGSPATNQILLGIDLAKTNVFFRLTLP